MAGDRKLTIVIAGDAKGAMDAFDKTRKAADGTGGEMETFGKKTGLALAAVGIGAVAMAKSWVGAGSDLEETVSKVNSTFGKSAAGIRDWADGAATGFGQSKQEALEAAASFGNMFTQLGIGGEQAADMSKKMTELASDFASFHNADITDVLAAQTAAFRGEYDAVQRFVPTINAAAVEQKALEMGLGKTTAELDAQDKALATQTLLLEGAGAAAGDFDRTSDSLANKQRILAAQFGDVQAKLGAALVPALADVASVASGALGVFEALPGPVQDAGAKLVAFGTVGLGAAAGVAFVIEKLKSMGETFGITLPKMKAAEGGLTALGTAGALTGFVGGVAAIGMIAGKMTEATVDTNAFAAALLKVSDASDEQAQKLVQGLDSMGKLDAQVEALAGSNIEAARQLIATAEAAGMSSEKIDNLRKIVDEKVTSDVEGKINAAEHSQAIQTQGEAAQIAAGDLKALADQITAMFNPLFAAQSAQDALTEAQKRATQAAVEHGAGSTQAATADDAAVQAAIRYHGSLLQLEEGIESGNVDIAAMNTWLDTNQKKLGITGDQAHGTAGDFLGLAIEAAGAKNVGGVNIPVTTPGLDTAITKFQRLADKIRGVASNVGVAVTSAFNNLGERNAAGGLVGTGPMGFGPSGTDTVPAWLTPGEFVIKRSVVNRLGTGALAALNSGRTDRLDRLGGSDVAVSHRATGAGGMNVTVNVTGTMLDPEGTAQAVVDAITTLGKQHGRQYLGVA